MAGILFSLMAGIFVTMQMVFNARVSENVGLWETTTIVHAVGFLFSLAMLAFFGDGHIGKWGEINKLYLLGGTFGVIIIYSMAKSVLSIGATLAVSVLLVSQLTAALLIDVFGLFGTNKIVIDWTKPMGIIVILVGIIIFKIRG
ncbi:MAG: DMT family transporter [Clostridiales bacterium]|nr:DMT family transporter [Clostridiales bacterium]